MPPVLAQIHAQVSAAVTRKLVEKGQSRRNLLITTVLKEADLTALEQVRKEAILWDLVTKTGWQTRYIRVKGQTRGVRFNSLIH